MLDRLAQLIVDRLRPQLERIINDRFEELRQEIHSELDDAFADVVETFNTTLGDSIPKFRKDLEKEVAQKIVRGLGG